MDITLALLLFSFIILLYWVITEVFTFIFRLTGLPEFQSRASSGTEDFIVYLTLVSDE